MKIVTVIFVLFLCVIFLSFLILPFPEIEHMGDRSLNKLREYFGMPIEDMGLMYHLDEGSGDEVGDSSSHKNNGIAKDGRPYNDDGEKLPEWGSKEKRDVFLKKGSSLVFDGVDDYIEVTESSDFPGSLSPDTSITIDLWIRLKEDRDCGPNTKWYLMERGSAPIYQLILEGDWTITTNFKIEGSIYTIHSEHEIFRGSYFESFNHIAVTYDNSTGEAKIYINGFLDKKENFSPPSLGYLGPYDDNDKNLKIGVWNPDACSDKAGGYFVVLDEVRIYNRALPAYETVAHYQGIY